MGGGHQLDLRKATAIMGEAMFAEAGMSVATVHSEEKSIMGGRRRRLGPRKATAAASLGGTTGDLPDEWGHRPWRPSSPAQKTNFDSCFPAAKGGYSSPPAEAYPFGAHGSPMSELPDKGKTCHGSGDSPLSAIN